MGAGEKPNRSGAQETVVKPADAPSSDLIRGQQIALLYRQMGIVLIATFVLASLIVLMLWPVIDHDQLLWWLGVYLLVTLGRYLLFIRYEADPDRDSNSSFWGYAFVVGAGLAGLTWGAAAVLFFVPDEPVFMLALTCLYSIVVAVAAQPLGSFLPAFFVFSTSMIVPLMGQLIVAGGDPYRPIGLIGFLYLAAIFGFAYNTNKTIISSIRLRFENIDLIEELSEQKAKAEASQRLAEAAIVAKSKFLAAASHDLRQPLHALGLFQDALEPHVDENGNDIMDRMRQSISALGGLFDSLLDISRLDAGVFEVNRRNIRLQPLLIRLADEYRPRAEEKGLVLTCEGDEVVIDTDPVILERILRNLLSNAIRYTNAGSVTLECHRHNDGVRVAVVDTGKGIDPDEMENIFSEYHQLHHPDRDRTKGLGLGLSIVKRLCKLIGLDIRLESEVGVGSRFYLDLPLGDAKSVGPRKSTLAWDLRGSTILIIDDEPDILHSTGRVVERWGCRAVLAKSLHEAVDAARTNSSLSAIVADYRLGNGETGIQAIAAVHKSLGREIPALLISGDTAQERLQEVRRSGLRLLHKPVMPGELRTALVQELIDQKA